MSFQKFASPRLMIGLDVKSPAQALLIIERLSPEFCGVKIGHALFAAGGVAFVDELVELGFKVVVEVLLNETLGKIERVATEVSNAGVAMINLCGPGGRRMMEAVVRGAKNGASRPVIVRTAIDSHQFTSASFARTAILVKESGVHGMVCSSFEEASTIRERFDKNFVLVVSGSAAFRPDGPKVSPSDVAMEHGADYLILDDVNDGDHLDALKELNQRMMKVHA